MVGPNADPGRWSKTSAPIIGHIDMIDNETINEKNKYSIHYYNRMHQINIHGWIGSIEQTIIPEIEINDQYYPIDCVLERGDVSKAYNSLNLSRSGFKTVLPLKNLQCGYYKIRLKGKLTRGTIWHSIDQLWIKVY